VSTPAPAVEDTSKQGFRRGFSIVKIDKERGEVWGAATTEAEDSDGEVVDYQASKEAFSDWSGQIQKATDGKSLGNVREQHDSKKVVGHLIEVQPDDARREILVGAKVNRATQEGRDAWSKIQNGELTGFSIGAPTCIRKTEFSNGRQRNRVVKYTMGELSLVDNPSNPGSYFSMVKSSSGGPLEVSVVLMPFEGKQMEIVKPETKVEEKIEKAATPAPSPTDARTAVTASHRDSSPLTTDFPAPAKGEVTGHGTESPVQKAHAEPDGDEMECSHCAGKGKMKKATAVTAVTRDEVRPTPGPDSKEAAAGAKIGQQLPLELEKMFAENQKTIKGLEETHRKDSEGIEKASSEIGSLKALVTKLNDRLEKMEKSPAPGGPAAGELALPPGVRALEKGAFTQGTGAEIMARLQKAVDTETNPHTKQAIGQLIAEAQFKGLSAAAGR
jgi:hypothetical protein